MDKSPNLYNHPQGDLYPRVILQEILCSPSYVEALTVKVGGQSGRTRSFFTRQRRNRGKSGEKEAKPVSSSTKKNFPPALNIVTLRNLKNTCFTITVEDCAPGQR